MPTYQSVQTATTSSTTLTITKPTSLAVGDLMVAHITAYGGSTVASSDWNVLSGWTRETDTNVADGPANTGVRTNTQYKIADSGDVAASNFTFTWGGSSTNLLGGILRITGANPVDPIGSSNADSLQDATSPWSTNAPVTPAEANSLCLMFAATTGPGSSFSAYNFATDNPSWTEIYDTSVIGAAYATRTQTTSSGNVGYSFSGSDVDTTVQVLVVRPTVAVTVTQVAGTLVLTGGTTATKIGIKIAQVAGNLILAGGSTLVKIYSNWTNQTKPTSTWTNQSK